ncbi:unnamed protein product, partial [Acanthoscelides obtectus]
WLQSLQ